MSCSFFGFLIAACGAFSCFHFGIRFIRVSNASRGWRTVCDVVGAAAAAPAAAAAAAAAANAVVVAFVVFKIQKCSMSMGLLCFFVFGILGRFILGINLLFWFLLLLLFLCARCCSCLNWQMQSFVGRKQGEFLVFFFFDFFLFVFWLKMVLLLPLWLPVFFSV